MGGTTFARILQTLDAVGYDCEWQLLNSKNFGVPQNRENNGEPMFTLTAQDRHGIAIQKENIRIRKLTPLECFRLQGFSDEHYYNARAAGLSDTQLYKQAGNAVTVPVIYEIAKRL